MKDKFTEISLGALGVENKNGVTYSTEGFPDTKFVKNEDGTYTLSKQQLDHLSTGKLKFIEDRLYINGGSFTVTGEQTHPKPLMVIEPSLTENLNSINPIYMQPTKSQKECINNLSDIPEITGVSVGQAETSSLSAGTEKEFTLHMTNAHTGEDIGPLVVEPKDLNPKAIDLDNLPIDLPVYLTIQAVKQKAISAPPEWNGCSNVAEFNKYISMPLTIEDQPLSPEVLKNQKRRDELMGELERLLERLYEKEEVPSWRNFTDFKAYSRIMFNTYIDHIDGESFDMKLRAALHVQGLAWRVFRGYTITILRYYIAILKDNDERYVLNDPITL